jgi:uncharacterized membrane protein
MGDDHVHRNRDPRADPAASPFLAALHHRLAAVRHGARRPRDAQLLQQNQRAGVNVVIAVGQKDAPGVSTGGDLGVSVEGWWEFAPGECAKVSNVDAGGSWLYYTAHSSQGVWEGRSRLCVRNREFKSDQLFLGQHDKCKGDFRAVGFKRIGAAKKNHTLNLTR